MKQHEKNFLRIARCAEGRAELLAEKPSLTWIYKQIALRSQRLKISSMRAEMSAARRMIKEFEIRDGDIIIPEIVSDFKWMTEGGEAVLNKAVALLTRSGETIENDGRRLLEIDLLRLSPLIETFGEEELIDRLTGVSNITVRTSQKDQRHISERDIRVIEMELSSHDPMASIASIPNNWNTDIDGLLRIFAPTIWATGMRPAEVWSSTLWVPRRDIPFTHEMREKVKRSPTSAILDQLMVQVEASASQDGERSPGTAAINAIRTTKCPPILAIRSAKQTNANPDLRRDIRLQVLDGVDDRILNMIAAAACLRSLKVSKARQDSLRASMDRNFKRIGAREPLLKDMKLNLYALRHSFATRVKATMSKAEAAALTGHTSFQTLSGYGERGSRKARGSGIGWLPNPDPERAAEIVAHMGLQGADAEIRLSPSKP